MDALSWKGMPQFTDVIWTTSSLSTTSHLSTMIRISQQVHSGSGEFQNKIRKILVDFFFLTKFQQQN